MHTNDFGAVERCLACEADAVGTMGRNVLRFAVLIPRFQRAKRFFKLNTQGSQTRPELQIFHRYAARSASQARQRSTGSDQPPNSRYLGRNPTKICFTIPGTRSSRGAPLNFPSVEIDTRPWSAALRVKDKRAGSPGTISPSA